ncbi:MAG: HAMP domain-containing histidine kinase [Dethiobacter sp.]|jgi:signal transduction histidine kinase|nr:HAMP domain-containing histidine kinase [Dethiobacter sp.]MBS4022114.1 HAMP domain-containing histidine kinase [Dethiobacter sp.]
MKKSISHRLTLAMVTLAVGGIILTALLTNLALDWNFRRYLRSTQEAQNRRIVETLAELYSEATSWLAVTRSTRHVGTTTGTQIRVFDMQNQLIADSLTGMMQSMQGRHWQRAQEQRGNTYSYPLFINEQRIGTVEITHLGQVGLWSGEALFFRRTVNQTMLVTGLGIILIAALAGNILSRRMTRRLENMTEAAEKLGRGDFSARTAVDGEDELAVLGETMNRMASRLEEQTALRKKLTGDISHELRTPLTAIQSFIEAFLDSVMHADEENLQAVLGETHRLAQLVNDLQELSNAECRDRDISLNILNLNSLVALEAERTRPLFRQKGIELVIEDGGQSIECRADELLLGRVLGNLLVNAWKYTPAGGRVTVATFSQDDRAGFTVSDTGEGIEEEHLPYIFERFYRADPSRSRTTGGSGIGLAIVLELVQAMGGAIDVESTPGQGSTFRVTLQV